MMEKAWILTVVVLLMHPTQASSEQMNQVLRFQRRWTDQSYSADAQPRSVALRQRFESSSSVDRSPEPDIRGYVPGLSVIDFGAKADGSDDTGAFQRALDNASAAGAAVVLVPAGTYTIQGHLTVHANCELRGINNYPYRSWGSNTQVVGTTLLAYEGAGVVNTSAPPFIFLSGANAAISGMSIFYPGQVNGSVATPVPYPWCLQGSGDDVTIKNMFLVNPYMGIDLATYPAGRHLVDNVYGNPLKIGIIVDQCYDVGRIRHIHFWNFWVGGVDGPINPLQKWVSSNGVTIKLLRTDWEVLEDVFSWGYSRGLVLDNSPVIDPKTKVSIGAFNGQLSDIQFDAVDIGVEVLATDPYGVFFSNLNLANAGWGDNRIGISCPATCDGNVVVRGASFWGQFHKAVSFNGSAFMSISDSTVEFWDSNAAMEFNGGRATVRGCTFGVELKKIFSTAIALGEGVMRAIVTDNDLLGAHISSKMATPSSIITNNLQ